MSPEGNTARLKEVGEEIARTEKIDDQFTSLANHAKADALEVILSGTLWDSVRGLDAVHGNGGRCIVQEPSEAAYPGLLLNAIKEVPVDFVGTVSEIIPILLKLRKNHECS